MSTTPTFRADAQTAIIGSYLKQLRLPAIAREYQTVDDHGNLPIVTSS